jgi:hypothetical protein
LIGDQLEAIDLKRFRAAEAKELIHYFSEFQGGKSHDLELLRNGGPESQHKVKIFLFQEITIYSFFIGCTNNEKIRRNSS